MISLGNVLIVDDSDICREVLAIVMAPYCDRTLHAESGHEAIELVERGDIDLVLCDVVMKNGDGFDLLERVSAMGEAAPKVLMVTAFPREQAAERALEMGAVGYLTKPTTVRRILDAVAGTSLHERRELKERWRCPGKAYLIECDSEDHAFVSWDVYNLSSGGAFLETKGPLPLGAEIDLLLVVGGRKALVRCQVARVQEPSWIDVGGVGVRFLSSTPELERLVEGTAEHMTPEDDGQP